MRYCMYVFLSLALFACSDEPSAPTSPSPKISATTNNIVGPVDITAKVSEMGPSKWLTKLNINIVVGDRTKIKRIRWTKGRIQLIRGYTGDFTRYWNEGDDVTMTITVGGVDVRLSPGRTRSFASDWNLNNESQSSIIEDISTGDVFTLTIGSEGTPIVKKEYPNPSVMLPFDVTYPSSDDYCADPASKYKGVPDNQDWIDVFIDPDPVLGTSLHDKFARGLDFAIGQWEQYVSVERGKRIFVGNKACCRYSAIRFE